jgi:hypothetical protein
MNNMHFLIKAFMFGCCLLIFSISATCRAEEGTTEVKIRLANGVPVEGTFRSAAPEGLTVQTASGNKTLPWKYLSTGTRWRYERPMLEAKRIRDEQQAKAKAEAAAKAATTNKSPVVTGTTTNKTTK